MRPEDVPQEWVDVAMNMYWDTDDDYNASMRAALAAVVPLIAAAEREACANVAEAASIGPSGAPDMSAVRSAAAIRARRA